MTQPLPTYRDLETEKLNRKSSGLICSILCTSTGKVMDTKRTQLFQQIRKKIFFFVQKIKKKQNKNLVDSNISKYDFVHEKRCVDFNLTKKRKTRNEKNKQTLLSIQQISNARSIVRFEFSRSFSLFLSLSHNFHRFFLNEINNQYFFYLNFLY